MVGLFTIALALLSLATGEVLVQILYRYGVIKSLDLPRISLGQLGSRGDIYSHFFYNVLILRFLPSAAVLSWLVGGLFSGGLDGGDPESAAGNSPAKNLHATGRHQYHILETHATPPFYIDPGLHGENHPGLKHVFR